MQLPGGKIKGDVGHIFYRLAKSFCFCFFVGFVGFLSFEDLEFQGLKLCLSTKICSAYFYIIFFKI